MAAAQRTARRISRRRSRRVVPSGARTRQDLARAARIHRAAHGTIEQVNRRQRLRAAIPDRFESAGGAFAVTENHCSEVQLSRTPVSETAQTGVSSLAMLSMGGYCFVARRIVRGACA